MLQKLKCFVAMSDPVPARKCAKRNVKQMLILENAETIYLLKNVWTSKLEITWKLYFA